MKKLYFVIKIGYFVLCSLFMVKIDIILWSKRYILCSVHGLNIKKVTFCDQNMIYCALFMAWLPLPSVSQAVPQPSYWLIFYDISIILFHFLCCCPHIYPHHLCLMSLSSYISPLKYIVFSWIPFLMKFWQNLSLSFISITSSLICLCLHLLDFK